MSTLSDEVNKLKADLDAAEKSRDAYRHELAAEDPQLPIEVVPSPLPTIASEVETRLDGQRKQLDELLRRYTDEHPDVISARRLIAQLEGQKKREAEARIVADGNRPRGLAATSPVYQRIRVALAETEAQVASLRSHLSAQQTRLDQIRSMAGRIPQVEAELAQLNRDYDVIRKNYEGLVARRESASLGLKLDESSQLADFRVVEPPRVTPSPVFPSRLHLAIASVALALAAGLLVPLVMDYLRPTVDDADSLRRLTGRPVLGTVSLSTLGGSMPRTRARAISFGLAIGTLVLAQIGWLMWVAVQTSDLQGFVP